jgi:hypothetical protein
MARPLPLTITAPCLALLLSAACLNDNLEFDPSTGGATDSLTEGSSTSAASSTSSTTSATTTTGASATSGESDGSTTSGSTSAAGTDTDPDTDATSSSGACAEGYEEQEGEPWWVQEDMVVISQNAAGECKWTWDPPGDCRDGRWQGYVPMARSVADGTTYLLTKFDEEQLAERLDQAPYSVIGFKLRVVFYEANSAPMPTKTLEVAPIFADFSDWDPTQVNFRYLSDGEMWNNGELPASLGPPLTTFTVDQAATIAGEEEVAVEGADNPNTYHSFVLSHPFPPKAVLEAIDEEHPLSFAIYTTSPDPLELGTGFGVKTRVDPLWSDPALVPIYCVPK